MKKLNKEIGNYCENLAKEYLQKNKYRILDCNFRNFLGEIDIICIKDNLLIFSLAPSIIIGIVPFTPLSSPNKDNSPNTMQSFILFLHI